MMAEKNENLFGVHLAGMLSDKSQLNEAEKHRFRTMIERLTAAIADGHSCLVVDTEDEKLLLQTGLVSAGRRSPLVFFDHKLYLHRYYTYENRLADQIIDRAEQHVFYEECEVALDTVFGCATQSDDLQRQAARLAVSRGLAVISGGPGTGKTTTVVKILAVLLQVLGDVSVALAAPTGKAAMRLRQSLRGALEMLALPRHIAEAIPESAQTLHRLLGVHKHSPQFRHTRDNPLGYDVVVVDEASMVDLALMSKLVDALRFGSRLILLGDKDQLASVESGAVLAELIESMPDNTVVLQKSYRFDSGIKALAEAINGGDADRAWALLHDDRVEEVRCVDAELEKVICRGYDDFLHAVERADTMDYGELFGVLNQFRVLCGVRGGRNGVDAINQLVEDHVRTRYGYGEHWYAGKPVMIHRNDYSLGLYNGDVGICLRDFRDNRLKMYFEDEDNRVRPYLPQRLPSHQTAYAMTIHKSQGSEFDDVMIVLPDEQSPVLSRELLYTAVTRAKKSIGLRSRRDIFDTAVAAKTQRISGLSAMVRCRRI
ncbi:MAG: exodeoxyribonuclease V subunit alpha [Desulfopila sp.]